MQGDSGSSPLGSIQKPLLQAGFTDEVSSAAGAMIGVDGVYGLDPECVMAVEKDVIRGDGST